MADTPPRDREAFLSRWSRLKRQQETAAAMPSPAVTDLPQPLPDAAAAEARVEEQPVLTDADMPPVETLDANSDYSGFMSSGVSEALRRRALRKLFSLPAFNELDGLNDYDEDFTQLKPLGDTITYQMRQWMARDEAKREAAAEDVSQLAPAQGREGEVDARAADTERADDDPIDEDEGHEGDADLDPDS